MTIKLIVLAMLFYYIVAGAVVGIALRADRNKSKERAPMQEDIFVSLIVPLLPFVMIFAWLIMTPINAILWINKVKRKINENH